MTKFSINTERVETISDNINSLSSKLNSIVSNINGYSTSNSDGFDFSGAKSSITHNVEGMQTKIDNTVKLLNAVVSTHTNLQNSVNGSSGSNSSSGSSSSSLSSSYNYSSGGNSSSYYGGTSGYSTNYSNSSSTSGAGSIGSAVVSSVGGSVTDDGFINYYQYNYKNDYGYGTTIASAGCGPTSMAMAITNLTNQTVEPPEAASWSLNHGYRVKNNGTAWAYFGAMAQAYNLNCEQSDITKDKIISSLKSGKLIIMSMGPGHFTSGGHYIVLRGITDDGKIIVSDPSSSSRSNLVWDISVFLNEGKQMWSLSAKSGYEKVKT